MDRIEKFLRKLNRKEREAFLLLMQQLQKDYTKIPGLKKLKHHKNLFRIRVGGYRIIFEVKSKQAAIVKITERNEKTYKGLHQK